MTLPDTDLLVLAIVRDAAPAATVGTQIPRDHLKHLPFASARRFGGAAVHPTFLDRSTITVDTWGNTRKAAYDLAATIRDALYQAARNQTVYTDLGYLARFSETTAPAELRDDSQPDNIWRFQATYSLFVRPANN